MADRLGTEASGLPLIPAEHAVPPDEISGSLHISINVDDVLSPQKSAFSEEQFKLAELKKAEMSTVRKRGGMKLTFRVSSDHTIQSLSKGCPHERSHLATYGLRLLCLFETPVSDRSNLVVGLDIHRAAQLEEEREAAAAEECHRHDCTSSDDCPGAPHCTQPNGCFRPHKVTMDHVAAFVIGEIGVHSLLTFVPALEGEAHVLCRWGPAAVERAPC